MLSDALFKVMAEEIFVGVMVFDLGARRCVFANRMAHEIIEAVENVTAFRLDDLFPKDEREGHRNFAQEHVDMTGVFSDLTVRKIDGGLLIANVGVKPIIENTVLIMLQDVTIQKKLQREVMTKQTEIARVVDELQQQNEQLRALDKAKTRFLALTSHELRTPLSSIVATAKFIDDGLCDNPSEVLNNVKVILDEGQHLLAIVNDILDLSKIQAGKVELFVEYSNPFDLLKVRLEHIRKYAATRDISVTMGNLRELAHAYFDPLRLTQVFDNILSNAVKYNIEGGTLHVESMSRVPGFVTISFADSGPGIAPENHQKVFNEFETIEDIRNHQKGTGLGMPICKRLIELMGGKIYFESAVGRGTTFFVDIPLQKILAPECYKSRVEVLNANAS